MDLGLVQCDEPFTNLLTQGMVLKDGAKMSKSRGNTVDPQPLIDKYGADTVRLYVLFAAPPEQNLEWSDEGINGAWRFLNRLWRMVDSFLHEGSDQPATPGTADTELRYHIHRTIDKVDDDISRRYTFNTAIAAVMELSNVLGKSQSASMELKRECLETMVLLLAPIVPHITDALWRVLGHEQAVMDAPWPKADKTLLQQQSKEMAVQVNGKLRGTIKVPAELDTEQVQERALAEKNVRRHLDKATIKKVIVVPGKVVNVVVQYNDD